MADVELTDKERRAALAKELGYYPATLDPEDIDRHRRLNAALDRAPTAEKINKMYAHLRVRGEREANEAKQRAEVADLYEEEP